MSVATCHMYVYDLRSVEVDRCGYLLCFARTHCPCTYDRINKASVEVSVPVVHIAQ